MPLAFDVHVGSAQTSALLYASTDSRTDPHATVVLAHGAGGQQSHPFMVGIAERLAARGFNAVTFDFLYTHAGRRLPDKADKLEATWRAVIDAVRTRDDIAASRLLIGGKSMGGRIATHVAAAGAEGLTGLVGLVLLGYPLHPPGKPEQLRAAHLPSVRAPMLFVQGAKDTFGTPEELAPIVAKLTTHVAATRLVVVEKGDHSLAVRGVPLPTTLDRLADEMARFERGLPDR